jgi:hypothetical protein
MSNVTQADIDKLIKEAQINVKTVFGRCTVVAVELKNGFILVESNTSADTMNYSEAMGMAICMEKIKNRLMELEDYKKLGGN